jgi:quinoprotein dehydrogenase-associated probable ABC transporter substrate-binding protein
MRLPANHVLSLAALAAVALVPTAVGAQTGELVDRAELRVCEDPNNLPFSNERQEGFENKIADLLGGALKLPVRYVWFPQTVGFVRNTLRARQCDLIMGTVAGDDLVQNTNPYYYTTYVMAYRSDKGLSATGLDDPALKDLRFGIVAGTPPSDLMVRHGLMAHAKPYALMVDTRYESPPHAMINDVVDGTIDVALLWGPIAGYYISRDKLPLTMVPLRNEPNAARMDYHITMGVRANEPEWRRKINAVIRERQPEITAVLRDYGVPLLDEQGHLLPQ